MVGVMSAVGATVRLTQQDIRFMAASLGPIAHPSLLFRHLKMTRGSGMACARLGHGAGDQVVLAQPDQCAAALDLGAELGGQSGCSRVWAVMIRAAQGA